MLFVCAFIVRSMRRQSGARRWETSGALCRALVFHPASGEATRSALDKARHHEPERANGLDPHARRIGTRRQAQRREPQFFIVFRRGGGRAVFAPVAAAQRRTRAGERRAAGAGTGRLARSLRQSAACQRRGEAAPEGSVGAQRCAGWQTAQPTASASVARGVLHRRGQVAPERETGARPQRRGGATERSDRAQMRR